MTSTTTQPRDDAGEPAAEVTADASPRARLTRLKINRFRQVKPGTELRFDDGINVLLGRNGTGKTTLFEVCKLLFNSSSARSSATSSTSAGS